MKKLFLTTIAFSITFILQAQTEDLSQTITRTKGNIKTAQSAYQVLEQNYLNSLPKNDSLARVPREGIFNLYKRWEYLLHTHIDEAGNYDLERESDAIEAYLKTHPQGKKRVALTANWQPMGPYQHTSGNYSNIGRVECMAFHPTNASIFYIGSPSGGVWKTIDNGVTWQFMSTSWDQLYVNGLTIDPNSPNTIYALTGKSYIYKSTDAGATWSKLTTGGFTARNKLIIDPTNSSRMIATSWSGIIQTINGGTTWTNPYTAASTEDIALKPTDPNTVYATTSQLLIKSTNGGTSFNTAYTLPTGSVAANVSVTAAAPNNVYLVYLSNTPRNVYYREFGAMYKSTDNGVTFNTITTTNTPVTESYGNPCINCLFGDYSYHQAVMI